MAKDDPKTRILERVAREKVKFMRLQFTDILGVIKNVEVPDLQTFQVFPWSYAGSEKVARIICEIANPDGSPFSGCPRSMLKRVIGMASEKGFTMKAGPEAEFFLFQRRPTGEPT